MTQHNKYMYEQKLRLSNLSNDKVLSEEWNDCAEIELIKEKLHTQQFQSGGGGGGIILLDETW